MRAGTIAGKIPKIADGGLRRGTDVLKGMAFDASQIRIQRCLSPWSNLRQPLQEVHSDSPVNP